jgi:hypothetical protein
MGGWEGGKLSATPDLESDRKLSFPIQIIDMGIDQVTQNNQEQFSVLTFKSFIIS